jgi:hypothetical protein
VVSLLLCCFCFWVKFQQSWQLLSSFWFFHSSKNWDPAEARDKIEMWLDGQWKLRESWTLLPLQGVQLVLLEVTLALWSIGRGSSWRGYLREIEETVAARQNPLPCKNA